jgi:hypothetical protein
MIKKKYYAVDVKGWYHIQKSCILIWKHNLNKSTHISLNLKLKTLNNINGKWSQLNDYTNKITNGIQKRFITTMFCILKLTQLKIIMNGSISLKV